MPTSQVRWLPVITILSSCLGCSAREPDTVGERMPSANQALLDEVNQAQLWFHAKKTRPIWAKKLDQDQTVETLEGPEQVPAGTYLCRGEAGDVWPQSEERLAAKYTPVGEADAGGWQVYAPHPDAQGVLAAQIPRAFAVEAQWGRLSGKTGDFLVKNAEDRDVAYPDDVWIVDQALFRATYEAAEESQQPEQPEQPGCP